MLETLDINGKVYQPSDQAAVLVNEPAVYVEQLAREKWIDASFVHGRCFVDIESLVRFLSTERAERAVWHELLTTHAAAPDGDTTHIATVSATPVQITLAKASAVFLCAGLFGIVSWTMVHEQVTLAALRTGASAMVGLVSASIIGH